MPVDILNVEVTLIEDAKRALQLVDSMQVEETERILGMLVQMSDFELRFVLASLQNRGGVLYDFDLEKVAREISADAHEAQADYRKGNLKKTRKLLRKIIDLETKAIKQKRDFHEEKILVAKVTAEAAVIMFVRYQIDPYARYLGSKIDELYKKIQTLEVSLHEMQLKLIQMRDSAKQTASELREMAGEYWEKVQVWKSDEERERMRLEREAKTRQNQYVATTSQPQWVPHVQKGESYAQLFSDITYFTLLGALGLVVLFKNIPDYRRKIADRKKVRQMFEMFSYQLRRETSVLAQQCAAQGESLRVLLMKVEHVERQQAALGPGSAEQMRMISERLTELHRLANGAETSTARLLEGHTVRLRSSAVDILDKELGVRLKP